MAKTMADLWEYMGKIIAEPNVYCNGKWGQFVNGKQAFDCICSIKACGWEVPIGKDITANQYDYIANHKSDFPDVSISTYYSKASKKGTNLSKIPTTTYSFVYTSDNGHIGVYNPATKTVREMVGGSVMKAREEKLANVSYWSKWSSAVYFKASSVTSTTTASTAEDYTKNTIENRFKVKVDGKQIGAYTSYGNAVRQADAKGGVVIDGTNGKQIYPTTKTATASKELTEKSYKDYTANSGKYYYVMKEPKRWVTSLGAFSIFANAYRKWSANKSKGYHLYNANWEQLD